MVKTWETVRAGRMDAMGARKLWLLVLLLLVPTARAADGSDETPPQANPPAAVEPVPPDALTGVSPGSGAVTTGSPVGETSSAVERNSADSANAVSVNPGTHPENVARQDVAAEVDGARDGEAVAVEEQRVAKEPPIPWEARRLKFSFAYAPWKDVLDWLAAEAGLSLTYETLPAGTFNYTESREYSVPQAIDIVNSLLLTKGYTLVRRDQMMVLVNLEDGIPPNLVMQVTPEELDNLGAYEIVSCLFQLERMTPEEAEEELSKLLGPQGEIIVLSKARQVSVTETAGRLRTMRRVLTAVENPTELGGSKITELPLEHISPDEALSVIRQMMGMAADAYATDDGQVRLSTDALGTRLLVKATPDAIAELRDIITLIDVPFGNDTVAEGVTVVPQLEVYPISNADPEAVLQVMQTLLAGQPDVRLALDPKTDNLVALARPSQHATIRATLDQLQSEFSQIEIFSLSLTDPQTAKLAVESLFGISSEKDAASQKGPRVDVNPTTRQLLVRGTVAEIDRIRQLLAKMGETGDGGPLASEKGNVRMIPMTRGMSQDLLERALTIWPTIRGNKVRAVTPSAAVDAMRRPPENALPLRSAVRAAELKAEDDNAAESVEEDAAGQEERPVEEEAGVEIGVEADEALEPVDSNLLVPRANRQRSAQTGGTRAHRRSPPARAAAAGREPGFSDLADGLYLAQADNLFGGADTTGGAGNTRQVNSEDEERAAPNPGMPEIIVAPGPNGLLIASDDTAALDEFEELLRTLSDPSLLPSSDYTVFYLKYARAEAAAKLLTTLVTGQTDSGGSAMEGLADLAFGGMGGLFGAALGGGSTPVASGPVQIVPDARINALIVKAGATDIELIRQLLQVVDQANSPEDVETTTPPRLIPVYNVSAADVAAVVKEIYASKLAQPGAGGGGRGGQPDMREIINAMRRGRGGGDAGGDIGSASTEPAMTLGVDTRSNSLIVSAPDPLFNQVKALVAQLDEVTDDSSEVTRVVTISRANPESIQQALGSMFGEQVRTNTSASSSSSAGGPTNSRPNWQSGNNQNQNTADQWRQRMELFNALRGGSGGPTFGRQPGGTTQRGTSNRSGGRTRGR